MPNENDITERSNVRSVIEFNCPLYVHKERPRDQSEYFYTIGVWKGTMALSICIRQPLDKALAAVSELLCADGAPPRLLDATSASTTGSYATSHCSVNLRTNGQQ